MSERMPVTGGAGLIGGPPAWEAFNLGASTGVPLDYLIELIATAARVKARIVSFGRRLGDVTRTRADLTKAGRVPGYSPRISVQDGIPAFVHWQKVTHARQH
jgi:UDP-glucuronate 4-epimerase